MKPPAPRKATTPTAPIWFRCDYDIADVMAIKALSEGVANDMQQKRCVDWILRNASGIGMGAFVEPHPRGTDFILGRNFVGQQIVKLAQLPATVLDKMRADSKARREA